MLGFEQHGFGVAVLRVRCEPTLGEPVYFPHGEADPDLALVLMPDGWLTHGALIEASRVYLRCSGDWGPRQGKDEVNVRYWVPCADQQPSDGLPIFLYPEGEMACGISTRGEGKRNGTVL